MEGTGRAEPQLGSWQGMVLEENEQDSEVGELMDRDSEDLGITQCNKSSEERRDVIRHVYL